MPRYPEYVLKTGIQGIVRGFFMRLLCTDGPLDAQPHHTLIRIFTARGISNALWKGHSMDNEFVDGLLHDAPNDKDPDALVSKAKANLELWGLVHILRVVDIDAVAKLRHIIDALAAELRHPPPEAAREKELTIWTTLACPAVLAGVLLPQLSYELPSAVSLAMHVQISCEHFETAASLFTAIVLGDVRAAGKSRSAVPLRVTLEVPSAYGGGGSGGAAQGGGRGLRRTWGPRELEENSESFVGEVKAAVPQLGEVTFELLFAAPCDGGGGGGGSGNRGGVNGVSDGGGGAGIDDDAPPKTVVRVRRTYVLHYRSDRGVRSFERPFRALAEGIFLDRAAAEQYAQLQRDQGKTFEGDGMPAARAALARVAARARAEGRDYDAYCG
ncbi:unnamed protein product, partial [Phaeothamnion confervicola]